MTFNYVEWLTGVVYMDQPDDIETYGTVFNELMATAASQHEPIKMLERRIRDLT